MKKIIIITFAMTLFSISLIKGMEHKGIWFIPLENESEKTDPFPKGVGFIPLEDWLDINHDNDKEKNLSTTSLLEEIKQYSKEIKEHRDIDKINTFANSLLTSYDQNTLDKALTDITYLINEENYHEFEPTAFILVSAGANVTSCPNVPVLLKNALIKKDLLLTAALLKHKANPNGYAALPLLFYAKTKEFAELLIENGADIHIKEPILETNVLWHLIDNNWSSSKGNKYSEKNNVELFQFYLDKGVDPKTIRPVDNSSLLHHFAAKAAFSYNNKNFLELGKMLLNAMPTMINTRNKHGITPLDIITNETEPYKKGISNKNQLPTILTNYENGYKLLLENNAQTSK